MPKRLCPGRKRQILGPLLSARKTLNLSGYNLSRYEVGNGEGWTAPKLENSGGTAHPQAGEGIQAAPDPSSQPLPCQEVTVYTNGYCPYS